MEIYHLGHSCFKLRGKKTTLITDPFNPEMVGIKLSNIEADIVTISHQHEDHNFTDAIASKFVLVSGPGEYEIAGVRIIGINTFHDNAHGEMRGRNTVYRIDIDNIAVAHLGDLGHKMDDREIEQLDGVDVLLIPVGGEYTISSLVAAEIFSKVEPKIIIPMHYNTPSLNQNTFKKLEPVNVFLKQMGKEGLQPQPKLVVTEGKLPEESMVVVLES